MRSNNDYQGVSPRTVLDVKSGLACVDRLDPAYRRLLDELPVSLTLVVPPPLGQHREYDYMFKLLAMETCQETYGPDHPQATQTFKSLVNRKKRRVRGEPRVRRLK